MVSSLLHALIEARKDGHLQSADQNMIWRGWSVAKLPEPHQTMTVQAAQQGEDGSCD